MGKNINLTQLKKIVFFILYFDYMIIMILCIMYFEYFVSIINNNY